ncbi:MAG: hypothetical protein KGM44_03910 [bacterium]|nr:hypothetical protein [bacterium]
MGFNHAAALAARRVLFAFVATLALTGLASSGAATGGQEKNLVAAVEYRVNANDGRVMVDIYPIAVYDRGRYRDASVDIRHDPPTSSPVEWIHDFTLLADGRALARVHGGRPLAGAKNSSCSRDVFLRTRTTRATFDAVPGVMPYGATSTWRGGVAVTAYRAPKASPPLRGDRARYAEDVRLAVARALARDHIKVSDERTQIEIQALNAFDASHDGVPVIFARTLDMNRALVSYAWLSYHGGRPVVLGINTEVAAAGSRAGPNFFGTADIDGDGTDEVIIRNQYDTAASYDIYKLRRNRVVLVFRGPLFGC